MIPSSSTHILIVDDDVRIRTLMQKFLIQHDFWVSIARDAAHARRLLAGLEFDLIVLDIMMPNEDGLSFTRSLRETLQTPILLLSAKSETNERILGLEAGADDYVTKPFEPKELVLRIYSILRRTPIEMIKDELPSKVNMGSVSYDLIRSEMWEGDKLIKLTTTEVMLMRIFCQSLHKPVSRKKLVTDLARNGMSSQERAIDVQINRLRRKIEFDPKLPRYLQTVRGQGYMLVCEPS